MNMPAEKKNKTFRIRNILLTIALSIYAVAQSLIHNPDPDAFFLIDLGRYIVHNHTVPREAYWYVNDGLHTIVQQWLCDVVNYLAYSVGKDYGMVALGIMMNGILFISIYRYGKEVLKDKAVAFNASVFCWIALNQFISTRPYAITISVALAEVLILRR